MKIVDGQKGEGKKSCTTWFDTEANEKLKENHKQLGLQEVCCWWRPQRIKDVST